MSRELVRRVTMKDCDLQTFRVSGAGGQHRDKTSAGVRIVHRASGAAGQSGDSRSQHMNKRVAFRRMAESPKFKAWALREITDLDEWLDREMQPENILVEYPTDDDLY